MLHECRKAVPVLGEGAVEVGHQEHVVHHMLAARPPPVCPVLPALVLRDGVSDGQLHHPHIPWK